MKVIFFTLSIVILVSTISGLQLITNEGVDCTEDKECWCETNRPKCIGRISGCIKNKCVCYPDCQKHFGSLRLMTMPPK
uniref:Toxin n=1 Tax=Parastrongyloides trichosuri TaxID=131310 RepID=A0A0N4ZDS7_PARTI